MSSRKEKRLLSARVFHTLMALGDWRSMLSTVGRFGLTVRGILLSIILLITSMSGCTSAINNSESYYQNIPRRPINWREYTTD